MENLTSMIENIKSNLSQAGASQKDEIAVMKAMLNDRDYTVDVYKRNGEVEQYKPAEDARNMVANIVSSTTKISSAEAKSLADKYEFEKSDARTMINLSKEFIHSYMGTGRKLPLGGRAQSDVSLSPKVVEEKECSFPQKNEKGEYHKGTTVVPAHNSIRVTAPCPVWLKK